jgi:site-specific DNA recombinase
MNESKTVNRCAIYTRKSSEEGLEQSFNSLDAQRESCAAFITSQKQEGWRILPAAYDDGGYSGGTLDRPALKQLLADVEARKVDTIVVYKVDRLTRSLLDFAKIVETLDRHGVAFVSVTQQFNTTSSMGRLTLNILLSFAQFEREVTGERIRDKIAASKRKGMWMGGFAPLGYDCHDGKLVVNPEEAERVRSIFSLYLELGCVRRLRNRLIQMGIRSKVFVSQQGRRFGGVYYSRGGLYELLKNPIYVGKIHHRGQQHCGEHEAIVPQDLWDKVQVQLRTSHQGRRTGLQASCTALLTSILRDEHGKRFTPCHTLKRGKRYRYYFCPSTNNDEAESVRLPAHDIEVTVLRRLQEFLSSSIHVVAEIGHPDDPPAVIEKLVGTANRLSKQLPGMPPAEQRTLLTQILKRVVLHSKKVELLISRLSLQRLLIGENNRVSNGNSQFESCDSANDSLVLEAHAEIKRQGLAVRVVVPSGPPSTAASLISGSLVKALARAHDWSQRLLNKTAASPRDIARQLGINHRYIDRILPCAFLAPDIVEAILAGRQPIDLTVDKLTRNLPLSWTEQRKQLGFTS